MPRICTSALGRISTLTFWATSAMRSSNSWAKMPGAASGVSA